MTIDSKRIAGWTGLLLFMMLCASLTYWSTQWFRPQPRAVAPLAPAPAQQIDPALAAGLFGERQQAVAIAGNYRLTGVVVAENAADSVAIVSVDGQPARALRQGAAFPRGAWISEIHPTHVIVSAAGVRQRVELPEKGR